MLDKPFTFLGLSFFILIYTWVEKIIKDNIIFLLSSDHYSKSLTQVIILCPIYCRHFFKIKFVEKNGRFLPFQILFSFFFKIRGWSWWHRSVLPVPILCDSNVNVFYCENLKYTARGFLTFLQLKLKRHNFISFTPFLFGKMWEKKFSFISFSSFQNKVFCLQNTSTL